MGGVSKRIALRLALLLVLAWSEAECKVRVRDGMFQLLHMNISQIARMRGFLAEDHQVIIEGGYIINLVRLTNPLIKGGLRGLARRSVVLFLHGSINDGKNFLVNSDFGYPEDFRYFEASEMEPGELSDLIEHNNASKSLPFTLLNFGHEVWIINRRGNKFSLGNIYKHKQAHLGPNKGNTSTISKYFVKFQSAIERVVTKGFGDHKYKRIFDALPKPLLDLNNLKLIPNPKYWDFTLDDVIKEDFPAIVDYVLEYTGRKRLALVGHSTGAALPMQALSLNKSLNDKFTKLVLWAPAINLSAGKNDNLLLALAGLIEVPLKLFKGCLTSNVINPLYQSLIAIVCSTEPLNHVVCDELMNLFAGEGSDQNQLIGGHMTGWLDLVPSLELGQLSQYTRTYKSTMFDFGPTRNLQRYGHLTPPVYNMSMITTDKLVIFYSDHDTLASKAGVELALEDLRVPYEVVLFSERNHYKGLKFNHASYIIHENITRLLIEPSLRAIQEADAE